MEKIELGINWNLFRAGGIAYNTRSESKNNKFLAELMKVGLSVSRDWKDHKEDTTYIIGEDGVKSVAIWRVGVPVVEYSGSTIKSQKANSKGYCSRKKPPEVDSKAPYATERREALESGALSNFESQLLGSLGLSAGELVQIVGGLKRGEHLYQWGDSQKVIEAHVLGNGASKIAVHISEFGSNSDGFVVKYNYDPGFLQCEKEAAAYDKIKADGKRGLVARVYRYDSHMCCGLVHAKHISGKACEIVQDGVIFSEFCHSVGTKTDFSDERGKAFRKICWDVKYDNVGITRGGRAVLVDYAL